jgi:small subunit ribosomal protein S11
MDKEHKLTPVPEKGYGRQLQVGDKSEGQLRNREGVGLMPKKKKTVKGRRVRKGIVEGKAFIHSTFNNTVITIADRGGNVISWGSSGSAGFKGSRKGTPYAAGLAAQGAARRAISDGLRRVEVYIKGPGSGREAAIRALEAAGITVTGIRDVTPIPHNGCRPRGRRRV